ncbi:MAG: FISUMP domain-containing protein [Bacteroidota bacterium]|nr:FISUMP domain-containing protein [Bacteroidota bacterium]
MNAQKSTLELTFTALDSLSWLPLDSIKVMNRTKGGDTVLFWPDTVLVLDYTTGVLEQPQESTGLQLLQNYPNPVIDQTNITIYIPREDKVNIIIIDIWGKKIYEEEEVLKKGYHQFRFIPGAGKMFFFSVHYKGTKQCIKIIHTGDNVTQSSCLEYTGCDNDKSRLKRTTHYKGLSYSLGDTLLYIGYFDSLESGILDNPDSNKIYNFQFATNIPCPGIPTVNYEGQVYNTIQIFSQCWLKENMNAGTMIPGNQNMEDNEIIEKYCYDDDPANCEIYGGLYQWDEMMDYKTAMGARGICPEGWHVPTDEEWKVLEGAVDSYYGIGDSEWDDAWEDRGVNAGKNLKSITGWHVNTGSDLFGFTALPGGDRGTDGLFYVLEACCCLWTSTEYKNNDAWAWGRSIHYSNGSVYRSYNNPKGYGFSIRCLRD